MLRRLSSTADGLSDHEAARRLQEVGPNRLIRAQPVSALRIFANQLCSIVVFLLGAAGLVALSLGDRPDDDHLLRSSQPMLGSATPPRVVSNHSVMLARAVTRKVRQASWSPAVARRSAHHRTAPLTTSRTTSPILIQKNRE